MYIKQKSLKQIPGKHTPIRNSTSKKLALKVNVKVFQHENTRQWNGKLLNKVLHNSFSCMGREPCN